MTEAHRVVQCPSCGSDAVVFVTRIRATPPALEGEQLRREDIYLPKRFECRGCDLRLDGHELLQGAGLGGKFTIERTEDPAYYFSPAEEYFEEYNNM